MSKKRILLISTSFYPQNKISVLRVGQWAKYWAKNGYEVTVLTTKKYSFLDSLTLNVNLPSKVTVVEIDFLPRFLYTKKKLSVNALGNQRVKEQKSRLVEILKFQVRKLRNYVGSLYDIHDFWIKKATRVGVDLMQEKKFDYIVSSYSPPASHIVAKNIKNKFRNCYWIADFRDLWAYNHLQKAKGIFKIIEKNKEKRTLRLVDRIVTVSNPLSNEMKNHYLNKDIITIENGFDEDEFLNWRRKIKEKNFLQKEKITITYAGTIYPEKRDPTPLIKAINELIEENIINKDSIEINFYGNSELELKEILSKENLNRYGIVNINGFVSRQESLEAQNESDFLLFLEWNHPSARGVLTGKLFEYIVSGKPILAVGVDNNCESGKLIEKSGVGKNFITSKEIKYELISVFQKNNVGFYTPNVELISSYSREKQALQLIKNI